MEAIALVDRSERVRALLTRSRLTSAGTAVCPASRLADNDPLLVRPGTARSEIVSMALARETDRRYDPIVVVDEAWRLVDTITIESLLQESAEGDAPLRLAAEG